ncbi:MAG: hypothetical protein K0R57_6006 [Paenibacillaceae bacterium]|jgi:hypothetical protein|nr:hypothetical protein [Paenibacillaceae bacterium]
MDGYDEEDWDEETASFLGEINSVNTLITGDHYRDGALAPDTGRPGMEHAEDPYDPYVNEELPSNAGLHKAIADSYTEFGGELSPAQAVHPGLARQTVDDFKRDTAAYRGESVAGRDDEADHGSRQGAWGWIAMVAAVASLFYWPAVLAPAAAVLGVIAFIRGSKALGAWSVALGLVSLLAYFYLVPYYS